MKEGKRALSRYVKAAEELAAAVKHDAQHGEKIRTETVLALNNFTIAANAVKDLIEELKKNEETKH